MRRAIKTIVVTGFVLIIFIFINALTHNPSIKQKLEPISFDINESGAITHLSESIKFRTVSNQQATKKNIEEFKDFIGWLKINYKLVLKNTSLQTFNETLLFKWEGQDVSLKPILLTGHYDVVPVIPGTEDKWKEPPFSGRVDSVYVWGRGALDDKSGVIGILEAVTYLMEKGFKPTRTIYLSFGHDEEIGGVNGAALVAKYLSDNDIQLEWSLDEGSFLLGGFIPNVDKLVAAINVAEKGSVTMQVVGKAEGG